MTEAKTTKVLQEMTTDELRHKYTEVYGEPTESRNKDYLVRKLAATFVERHRDPRVPLPGAVVERTCKGKTVQAKVLESGFEYEGKPYRSLSAIAREVTGTPWNGLLFFRCIEPGKKAE